VTVIISMQEARGHGARVVDSWTTGQRCDPSLFETILFVGPQRREIAAAWRARMRGGDRLIESESSAEMLHHHCGAGLARGDILLFTEAHCVAQPDTVVEALKAFDDPGIDAIHGRSISVDPNEIARMETLTFEEVFAERSKPDHWCRVMIRAFAIRKAVYQAAGGFDSRFGHFADYLLAMRLHRQNANLIYAPGFVVEHINTTSFSELAAAITEFVDGECEYRAGTDEPDICVRYFGLPPEWVEAHELRTKRAGAMAIVRAALSSLGSPDAGTQRVAWAVAVRRALPAIVIGEWAARLRHRLRPWVARITYYAAVGRPDQRLQAYRRFWDIVAQCARVQWVLSHEPPEPKCAVGPGNTIRTDVFGFHPPERHDGVPFRWSSDLAGVWIPTDPPPSRMVLTALPVRVPQPPEEIVFCMNSRSVDARRDEDSADIVLAIEPRHLGEGTGQWLLISVQPLGARDKSTADPRKLGIPLSGIRVESDGGTTHRALTLWWSERRDLNSGPPVPQTGALTGLRYAPP
jgi:hypothetical protein